jgi:outer membrane protein assembly factor BamB/tRNA A-37 threonylcarbamoyl transferase component Bud32
MGRWATRREVLQATGTVVGGALLSGTTGVASAQSAVGEWRQYGRGRSNTAANEASDGVTVSPARQWDLNVNAPVRSGIAVANDTAYTFGANGDVYSVDGSENVRVFAVGAADGVESDDGPVATRTATPAVFDGVLYVGGLDGTTYALDLESQEQLWTAATEDPIRASPVVADGTVFVATAGGRVAAYDQVSGVEQWSARPGSRIVATPVVSDPALFVADSEGRVVSLRSDTGESVWTFDADGGVVGAPTLSKSRAFVAAESGTVYAVSQGSGEVDWDGTVPGSVVASPALAGQSLYVADRQGTVAAFDSGSGSERWRYSAGEGIVADPAVTANTVYLATTDGSVQALDRADGSRRWTLSLESGVVSPLTVAGGTLYVAREDGHLVSIQQDSGIATTAMRTVERNRRLAGGLVTLAAVSAAGYVGVRRYRSGGPTDEGGEAPASNPAPAGDASPIADRPTPDRRLPDLSEVTYDDFDTRELIGSGGSADVHRAVVGVDGREHTVALKTPRMSDHETVDSAFFEEFAEEAEIWNGIDDHESIVSVLGWGEHPHPWIALEYMEAGNLAGVLADVDTGTALAHLDQICDGVHHAHRHGVTHTDLKPENILYTSVDGTLVPKVTDWGLANVLLEHSTSVDGMTPAYAAPEQIEPTSYGGTDDRTDVFQLGVVAYELLTGRRPFDHDSHAATMNAILNESPTPPAELNEAVEPPISDAVVRALRKDKDQRYETALHFRDALRRAYDESDV